MIKPRFKNNPKKFLFLMGLVMVLAGIFVPTHLVHAEWYNPFSWFGDVVEGLFKAVSLLLVTISSFILIISGALFDWVVKFTVIDMAQTLGSDKPVGQSITTAWTTLRDVANICFIFVLLFAAFKAMFQLDFGGIGTTIRNIIIVALLINFSLFFTKVVIDASNIVSVGFYNSIVTSNNDVDSGLSGGAFGSTGDFKGISGDSFFQ